MGGSGSGRRWREQVRCIEDALTGMRTAPGSMGFVANSGVGSAKPLDTLAYAARAANWAKGQETVQFPVVHCLPKRVLLSASLGRGEAGCAGKSVLRVRTKSREATSSSLRSRRALMI